MVAAQAAVVAQDMVVHDFTEHGAGGASGGSTCHGADQSTECTTYCGTGWGHQHSDEGAEFCTADGTGCTASSTGQGSGDATGFFTRIAGLDLVRLALGTEQDHFGISS